MSEQGQNRGPNPEHRPAPRRGKPIPGSQLRPGGPAPAQPATGEKPVPADPAADKPDFDAPAPHPQALPRLEREKPAHTGGRPRALDESELPTSAVSLRDLDRSIALEMEAALEGMDELMGKDEPKRRDPNAPPIDRHRGRVVSIHGGDIFVAVAGSRTQGVMQSIQFAEKPKVGDEVEFDVERFDSANGLLILTKRGAAATDVDWSTVTRGMIVEAKVTAVNKGGLSVEVQGIRGFMPMAHIDMYRVEQPEQFLNQRLTCMVTEADAEDKNLVVSRRALMERERDAQKEKLWASLEVGQVRDGVVRAVMPFGAFVDLGGADGLVPAGELSWQRIDNPADVVSIGQKVSVKVMRIDPETKKIGLSLRSQANNPWHQFAERFRVGTIAEGTVTRLADFGGFVELHPGIEGLIHISELGRMRVRQVSDVLKVGQQVEVQILNVDTEQMRIGLSLRAVEESRRRAEESAAAASRPGTAAEPEAAGPPKPRVKAADLKGGVGGGGKLFPDLPSGR